jgi:hypothetical protein
VIAHLPAKEQAAPTWKKTFGHHPMTAWAGHGADGNGEPLAIVLSAGNAGSDTAADHIEAARLAVAQLPRHLRRRVLIRAGSGGGTHEFPGVAHREIAAAALLRGHDHQRGHPGRDRQGPGSRVDAGL